MQDLIAYKNISYNSIQNDELREKIWIFNSYYDFAENLSCLLFIEKSYKTLNNKELVLVIIILKSFLEKDEKVGFINSNDIFSYVDDQYFKYLLLEKKFIPEKKRAANILYILDILVSNGFIEEKIITYIGDRYKTFKFYKIRDVEYERPLISYFNFAYCEFKLIELNDIFYITTFHYSRTYEINKKNFNSNKAFKIKNIGYLMRKINTKLFVDEEYQEGLRKFFHNETKEVRDEIAYRSTILQSLYDKSLWTSQTKDVISESQKVIAGLFERLLVNYFANYNFGSNFIIFPLFTDFRGRKYYYSKIGPTESKILRLSYYYGFYSSNDFKEINNKYSRPYYETISEICNKHNFCNSLNFYEAFFWCLIGIGKIFNDKTKSSLKPEDFLRLALEYLNDTSVKKLDIEDLIEVEHYIRIMRSLKPYTNIKKRTLIKDATASINQIFMKKLGPINQESLNFVNLGYENEWYDTYLVYRDKFFETVKDNPEYSEYLDKEKYKYTFSRELIKKVIMIIPYSAGEKKCTKDYLELIIKKKKNIIVDKKLKKLFSEFYAFVKYKMQEKYLYQKNTQTLINKINEDFEKTRQYILESDTGESNISYYKMKKSSIDKKYEINGQKKRITKLILTPTPAIDIDSFNRASGANVAHFSDADEIREIEIALGYCIITIHDSYLVDFINCTKLIDIKISHYNKYIKKFGEYEIRNVFILI